MIISVLSGKGGTGKTTIATNLAYVVEHAIYVDGDVEEPNGFLFLKPEITRQQQVMVVVPEIAADLCIACGKCSAACQFNALAQVKDQVLTFPKLCHGCGLCSLLCPTGAISEVLRPIGVVEFGHFGTHDFWQGILDIGEPMSVPIIKHLDAEISSYKTDVIILDCAPGSSCSVIAAIEHSNFCLLVTEPTPFGLHDLAIAIELVELLGLPCAVVVNKADSNNTTIQEFCAGKQIPVLMEIPFDKGIVKLCSKGELLVNHDPALRAQFSILMQEIRGLVT